jgi:predicted alpha/beta-hydrolase family hydrolase
MMMPIEATAIAPLIVAAIASGLAESGWRVVRFEFPYMGPPEKAIARVSV